MRPDMRMYPPEMYAEFQDAIAKACAILSVVLHGPDGDHGRFETRLAAACPMGHEGKPVSSADIRQTAASFCRIILSELEAHP